MGLLTDNDMSLKPFDMWLVHRADGDIVNRWNNPWGMYGIRTRPEFEKYDSYIKSVEDYLLPDLCSDSEAFIRAYIKAMQSEKGEDVGFREGMDDDMPVHIDDVGMDILKSFYIDYFQTIMVEVSDTGRLIRRYASTNTAVYYLMYKVCINGDSLNTSLIRKDDWLRFTSRT